MYLAVDAIVKNGVITPLEAMEYDENSRFILIRLTPAPELTVSSVAEFSEQKQQEKSLNNGT